jgi:hypothetical protein
VLSPALEVTKEQRLTRNSLHEVLSGFSQEGSRFCWRMDESKLNSYSTP